MRGRNVIGGSIIIIERLRRSCRIVSGRWSHFSWPSSAAAMPVYFAKRCMKFTFREFSGEMSYFAANVLGARGALLSGFSSLLRTRTLGFTGGNGRRGTESHCGRSALHSHAGSVISNGHSRIGSTGGTNLLRARRALVSFAWSSAPPLRGTHRSVALFPPDGQDDGNNADRRTSSLTGARTE